MNLALAAEEFVKRLEHPTQFNDAILDEVRRQCDIFRLTSDEWHKKYIMEKYAYSNMNNKFERIWSHVLNGNLPPESLVAVIKAGI